MSAGFFMQSFFSRVGRINSIFVLITYLWVGGSRWYILSVCVSQWVYSVRLCVLVVYSVHMYVSGYILSICVSLWVYSVYVSLCGIFCSTVCLCGYILSTCVSVGIFCPSVSVCWLRTCELLDLGGILSVCVYWLHTFELLDLGRIFCDAVCVSFISLLLLPLSILQEFLNLIKCLLQNIWSTVLNMMIQNEYGYEYKHSVSRRTFLRK